MYPVIAIAFLALLGWGLWQALQTRPVFVVRITDGTPHVRQGTVTRGFLGNIAEACRHHGVTAGAVLGLPRGNRIALEFKGQHPPAFRQQLRNVWNLSGWSAGPGSSRPQPPRQGRGR